LLFRSEGGRHIAVGTKRVDLSEAVKSVRAGATCGGGGNGCGGLSNPNNRHLTLRKKNSHSVGVAAQYASALGKTANCQTLVSLTLARGEVPVMLALRLFLPESWTSNRSWLDRAGVPAWPLDRVAQIADRKYCRPHARPFRLRFARVVAVFPVCSPAAL
jgi:DDE superfamily endonuclease